MKYLKKFENHTEYDSAKEAGLILPNVSLCVAENEVYYNPKKAKAKLYDYLYSDLTFGSEVKDGIIGVCVIGGGILPDGKARFMSVKAMNLSTPDVGGDSEQGIYWGGFGADTSLVKFNKVVTGETSASGSNNIRYLPKNGTYSRTPHIPSPIDYFDAYSDTAVTTANSLSDFDGKGNTKVLTDLSTAQSDWKTADIITDAGGDGYYPVACACWRFNPGNTNQGDWYLPAMGELGFVIVNFDEINSKISAVSSGVQLTGGSSYWSSTEYTDTNARYLFAGDGYVCSGSKADYRFYARAFLAL